MQEDSGAGFDLTVEAAEQLGWRRVRLATTGLLIVLFGSLALVASFNALVAPSSVWLVLAVGLALLVVQVAWQAARPGYIRAGPVRLAIIDHNVELRYGSGRVERLNLVQTAPKLWLIGKGPRDMTGEHPLRFLLVSNLPWGWFLSDGYQVSRLASRALTQKLQHLGFDPVVKARSSWTETVSFHPRADEVRSTTGHVGGGT